MKNLVFLACRLGDNAAIYRKMLNTCVESLRTKGKFFGDIVVLKNVEEELLQPTYADYVHEYYVDGREAFDFKDHEVARAKGKHFKFILHHYIDCSKYDNILYLDIDIIAIRNINRMFCSDGTKLMYAVEDAPMSSDSFNHFIDEESMVQAAELKGVNSGTFCVPGEKYAEFSEAWKKNLSLPVLNPGYEWDQPALNMVVPRNEFPCEAYHGKTVYFPLLYSYNYGDETLLYHFNSKGQKEKDFNVMRSYLDLLYA